MECWNAAGVLPLADSCATLSTETKLQRFPLHRTCTVLFPTPVLLEHFFFSVVLLLRPWWYWFYILYIYVYHIYIYIICNRFTVALNQEALEARIEVSWHSGLKVWWWSFLAIVASNRSREAKVILGSFATRIFSSLQRLQCFCAFFCIWRETSLYTQRFRPHLIPSFALTAGQIYHVGPSSPEAEVHPVTVSVALCKRD